MKRIQLLIACLLFSTFSTMVQTADVYMGQFLYEYEGGNVYRVKVNDAKLMSWVCIAGSEKGASGMERPERFKVDDKIYFATWEEKKRYQRFSSDQL